MDEEQRRAYLLALEHGARKTAAMIRAHKVGVGAAIVSACREIGLNDVLAVLVHVAEPRWSLCGIRYAPGISREQQESLLPALTSNEFFHAQWVLENFRFLSEKERATLQWLVRH